MRLWHKDLIPVLPRKQLVGQWRECCLIAKNITEKGTPNHILVNQIMDYSLRHFATYTTYVFIEMLNRGYKVDYHKFAKWINEDDTTLYKREVFSDWHNKRYLNQCLYNLEEKYDCGGITDEEWYTMIDYLKVNNIIDFE